MRTPLVGAAAVTALALLATSAPPVAHAAAPPYPLGEPGSSCQALAPGAWTPRLPEASPRSEPLTNADLTVVSENAARAVPTCSNGRWTFTVGQTSGSFAKRRTEVMWSRRTGVSADLEGDVVPYRVRFLGRLGTTATSPSASDYHVLWQVHGRTGGVWRAPLMTLSVQQGRLVVTGSGGRWHRVLGPYRDDTVYDVAITTRFSTAPSQSRVTIVVNGQTIASNWAPGHATLLPGMDLLQHRSGLYHGTNWGSVSGAPQAVYMEFPG